MHLEAKLLVQGCAIRQTQEGAASERVESSIPDLSKESRGSPDMPEWAGGGWNESNAELKPIFPPCKMKKSATS